MSAEPGGKQDPSWELQAILNTDNARHDCAFCHRERTPEDDNHGPECPYWYFFGESPS
jgi:hypothetical protein